MAGAHAKGDKWRPAPLVDDGPGFYYAPLLYPHRAPLYVSGTTADVPEFEEEPQVTGLCCIAFLAILVLVAVIAAGRR